MKTKKKVAVEVVVKRKPEVLINKVDRMCKCGHTAVCHGNLKGRCIEPNCCEEYRKAE